MTEITGKSDKIMEQAKAESQQLVDYLKDKAPKDNALWNPEELQDEITKVLYESKVNHEKG